jgi:hypothetical protein
LQQPLVFQGKLAEPYPKGWLFPTPFGGGEYKGLAGEYKGLAGEYKGLALLLLQSSRKTEYKGKEKTKTK